MTLNVKGKLKIILLTLFCFIESLFVYFSSLHNDFLFLLLFFTYAIYFHIHFKKIKLSHFTYPTILLMLALCSNSLSTAMINFVISNPDITMETTEYAFAYVLVSKQLFAVLAFFFYIFTHKKYGNMQFSYWWPLAIFGLIASMMFTNFVQNVIFKNFTTYTIYSLMFEFILLIIVSIFIYYKIKKQNQLNIDISQELIRKQYQDQMYHITNRMINEMNADKHMMLYHLMSIDSSLAAGRFEDAKTITKKEINNFLNYKYISSTGYALFDYELTKLVNELTIQNKDVKVLASLGSEVVILNEGAFVSEIMSIVRKVVSLSKNILKVDLFFQDTSQYIIFKVVIQNNEALLSPKLFQSHYIHEIKVVNEESYSYVSFLLK